MYDFAMENLEHAHRLNPELFEATNLLGDLYLRKKNKLHALELYSESLSVNERQEPTHIKAGEIDDFYTRYDDALSHFNRAIELNPESYRALIGAARIYSIQGNVVRANSDFSRAYEIRKGKSQPLEREADKLYSKKKYL
ncbi:MAG TPA: tetratricopeptide repeat protein, partial [Spirochaetota bacterium]